MDELSGSSPYSMRAEEKRCFYTRALTELTQHHASACPEYARLVRAVGFDLSAQHAPDEQPMLPVRLFKMFDMRSVAPEAVAKTLTSSGTSGGSVSKIFLDKENIRAQTRALTEIITSFIGKQRLPLLILDTQQVKTDRAMFSARGAGVVGFSVFGRDVLYALDDSMEIDVDAVISFIDKHRGERILIFGYTYMIWQFTVMALRQRGISLDIGDGVMFHIGGWKKLRDQAVDTAAFNESVASVLGRVAVHNYYGMAEQLGSVFVECEHGSMHCSNYSDIIVRRPRDLSVANFRERGAIELLSLLPTSYPGHVLLTEDEGEILGEDDCPCGRNGRYFKIHGRLKGAELRGCSDTYERR